MRLRFSLAVPIMGLIIAVALSMTLSQYYVGAGAFHDTFMAHQAAEAESIYFIVNSLIKKEIDKLAALSKALKGHRGLSEGIARFFAKGGDIGPLKESMDRLYAELDIDLFVVTDREGRIIYRANPPEEEDWPAMWGVAEAVAGKDMIVTEQCGHGWAIRAIVPAYLGDEVYGTIKIATEIDDNFAGRIAAEIGAHVSFGSQGGLFATSLPPEQRSVIDPEDLLNSLLEIRPIRREHPGLSKVIHYAPIQVVDQFFSLMVEFDTSAYEQLLDQNQKRIFRIFLLLLLIALSLGAGLTIYLVRPLKKLQRRAEETVRDISGVELGKGTGNEVQSLVQSFNAMVDTLTDHMAKRTQAMEELQSVNETLRNRTQELEETQEQLVRKERLATLGQLTSIVSHELRNPLGTIQSSLFSIRERLRDREPGADRALDRAERSVIRCDNIIEELLDYTRTRELNLEPTMIDEWMGEFLNEQAIPGGILLDRKLTAGMEIPVDRERFRRCLINIINNATEAMITLEGAERNQLTVETRIEGDRLKIAIIDTGPGISPDQLGKVFEPLYSTKSFGVGLGLPIARQIMEQHGGGIEIESEVGKGTVVTLWLPVKD